MGRVLDGDRGGFVDTLAEFTPETMGKKELKEGKKNATWKKRVKYLFSIIIIIIIIIILFI